MSPYPVRGWDVPPVSGRPGTWQAGGECVRLQAKAPC
jgi:hypothetical protein